MDATQGLAAILRDARKGALLRMRSEIYSQPPSRAVTAAGVARSYSSDTTSRPRCAKRPRRALNLPPKEGVGNAGCPMHPRSRVHFVVIERTRVTTSTPESPGIPARNGFNGLLRA